MQKLKSFLTAIESPNSSIQIGELNRVLDIFSAETSDLQTICALKKDIYFLGGVKKGLDKRAQDGDIQEKNYMAFDFDLAKDREWSPKQIKIEAQAVLEFLRGDDESRLSRVLAMVFSGGGVHIYYRTPTITNFDNWRGVYEQARIKLESITTWKADSACKNPSRIMRLPESFSAKRGIQTEILHLDTEAEPIFTLADYENFKPRVKATVKPATKQKVKIADLNGHTIRQLSNKTMLELLSGTELVNGEVFSFRTRPSGGEYIDVDGKPANAWLDVDGKIGSGSKAGPTWVEWLKWYGRSDKEVNQFLYDNKLTDLEDDFEGYEIDREVKVFTWGTPRLDQQLTPITPEQSNILTGNTGAGKTTFAFDVAWKNAELGHRVLYLSLEMSKQEIETRLARAYAGINKAEWRDRAKISPFKKLQFKKRVDELRQLKTLTLSGMSNTTPTLENIFKVIKFLSPDLVFLDNFDLIQKRQGVSAYEEENRISAAIKEFPKENQIPIIVLHHRGKAKNSSIDGVRGSGKITHDRYTALRCEREFSEDGTDQENAQFYLVEEKDRDFGYTKKTMVYFKHGSFYDNF